MRGQGLFLMPATLSHQLDCRIPGGPDNRTRQLWQMPMADYSDPDFKARWIQSMQLMAAKALPAVNRQLGYEAEEISQ